jgi:Flp pilus assembly protein TadD
MRPLDPELHNDVGSVLASTGKLDDAIRHYREAIRLAPDDTGVLVNLSGALLRQGRADEAVSHLERALAIDPNDANAHYTIAVAVASRGEYARAWREIERARRLGFDPPARFVEMLRERMAEGSR